MRKILSVFAALAMILATACDTTEKENQDKVLVNSVVLNKFELTLEPGQSETLVASVKPDNATDKTITWSSSDEDVASVNSEGKVVAKKEGVAVITAQAGDKNDKCKVLVQNAKADEYTVTMSKTELSIVVGQGVQLKRTVTPQVVNVTSVWTSSNTAVATVSKGLVTGVSAGQATITVDVLGYKATCQVTVSDYNTDEAVDLGLSVKWRGWNLGATRAYETGNYYAWGETEPKEEYWMSNYRWWAETDKLSKYTNGLDAFGEPDNKLRLELEDDIAHILLGGGWRLPTEAEVSELCDNCDFELTTLYGVRGFMFTSRTNGNYIFLPGAGMKIHDHLSLDDNRFGRYWTSDVSEDWYAYMIRFEISAFNGVLIAGTDAWSRYTGMPIRPVTE
jgi:uncharacterized protein YjdB